MLWINTCSNLCYKGNIIVSIFVSWYFDGEQDKNFLVAFSHGNRVILILQQIMKQKNMVVGGLIPNRLPHPPPSEEWAC